MTVAERSVELLSVPLPSRLGNSSGSHRSGLRLPEVRLYPVYRPNSPQPSFQSTGKLLEIRDRPIGYVFADVHGAISMPGLDEQGNMPLFKIGDYVERVGTHVPQHMKFGRIVRVIPHSDLPQHLTEYAVDFRFVVATYYHVQLKPAVGPRTNEGPPTG